MANCQYELISLTTAFDSLLKAVVDLCDLSCECIRHNVN